MHQKSLIIPVLILVIILLCILILINYTLVELHMEYKWSCTKVVYIIGHSSQLVHQTDPSIKFYASKVCLMDAYFMCLITNHWYSQLINTLSDVYGEYHYITRFHRFIQHWWPLYRWKIAFFEFSKTRFCPKQFFFQLIKI